MTITHDALDLTIQGSPLYPPRLTPKPPNPPHPHPGHGTSLYNDPSPQPHPLGHVQTRPTWTLLYRALVPVPTPTARDVQTCSLL